MDRNELLELATELQNSIGNLPLPGVDGYSRDYNNGYRTAILEVVGRLLKQVEELDKKEVEK